LSTTITTFIGREVDPLNLTAADIDIRDIAHALALLCRFNGHCARFYSVAQHSVWVSRQCGDEALIGLLHDAAEAYLGDIPTPVKHRLPAFKTAEEKAEQAIAARFGLQELGSLRVKAADAEALGLEKRHLLHSGEADWAHLACETWEIAERNFLTRFEELTRAHI